MGGRFFNANSIFLENDNDFAAQDLNAHSQDNYFNELSYNNQLKKDMLLQSLLS